MLVCGRPVILLLLITFLDFHPSEGTTDDYDQLEDITTVSPSSSFTNSEMPESNLCNYDMCVEQQKTCQELAIDTKCLCPGLSSVFVRPSPPYLLLLTQQDDKGVKVQWCAPTSIVTHYIVWVIGNDKVKEKKTQVEEMKRAVVLKDVEAGAQVCVEAVNKAGSSKEECATFEVQHSDSGLALKLGITGGVVGLILLLILALLLWRHKTRQKSMARTETEGVL